MYCIALKESPTLLRVTENKKISSSHPMAIRGRRSREASITKKGCTRWWDTTYFYLTIFLFLHVVVAVLFFISKFALCLLSTHFVLCSFKCNMFLLVLFRALRNWKLLLVFAIHLFAIGYCYCYCLRLTCSSLWKGGGLDRWHRSRWRRSRPGTWNDTRTRIDKRRRHHCFSHTHTSTQAGARIPLLGFDGSKKRRSDLDPPLSLLPPSHPR